MTSTTSPSPPQATSSTPPAFTPPPYPYSALVLNVTWNPPFSQMNFTRPENCKICGEFLASWSQSAQARDDHALGESWLPGIRATTRCFRAALPPGYTPVPTDTQLLELYLRLQSRPDRRALVDNVTDPILKACRQDLCRALAWEGNGDLSGIGVFTSFTIEAVLATLYLVVLGAAQLRRFKSWRLPDPSPSQQHTVTVPERILGAFAATLPGFRSTAAFFCTALLIAALAVVGKAKQHPEETTSYEVLTATLVCVFSVFPVVLLNALGRHERRPAFHQVIVCLLGFLAFVQVTISQGTNPERAVLDTGATADAFMVYCPMRRDAIFKAVQATYCLYLAGAVLGLVFSICDRRWRLDRYRLARAVKTYWRLVAAVPCVGVMWAYLGVYQSLRAEVLDRAGPTNRDNDWTFGQLVAVLAWAPVMLEFGYRMWYPHDGRATELKPPATPKQEDNSPPVGATGDEALMPLVPRSTV